MPDPGEGRPVAAAEPLSGPPPSDPIPRGGRARRRTFAALLVVAAVLVAAVALRAGPAPLIVGPGPGPGSSRPAGAAPPRLAIIDADGALATIDAAGHETVVAADLTASYGFPAWSPDGTRIAVVAGREDASSIEIFDAPPPGAGLVASGTPSAPGGPGSGVPGAPPTATPVVVFRSAESRPFYLYWAPDGRRISFLATETDGLSLRVAPADGSGRPGGDPAGIVAQGSPLYFDWIADDRLLVHVGTGSSAVVREIRPDGTDAGPPIDGSGDYRPAVADGSGRYLAVVRGTAAAERLVVSARDGSDEHGLAVLGPTAMAFDPAGSTLATIAADRPERATLSFPIGPLRLVDPATGVARTLLDGDVVGFFWSPDGRTIAALRLQGGSGTTVAAGSGRVLSARFGAGPAAPQPGLAAVVGGAAPSAAPAAAASPEATPGATPGSEVHLLFVATADGSIRSDRVVHLTSAYVNQLLPYFDQYALSHRTWAADGSAVALPLLDDTGAGRLVVLPADGSEPRTLPGRSGFWSP